MLFCILERQLISAIKEYCRFKLQFKKQATRNLPTYDETLSNAPKDKT